jgi:hypothetical protein
LALIFLDRLLNSLFTTTKYKGFIEDYFKKFGELLSSITRSIDLLGLYEILNCIQPREWGPPCKWALVKNPPCGYL